jgi:hypothetical protein
MKKVSFTIRVPIFIDAEVEMAERDYNDLIDEWDKSNFGIVRTIVSEYVDLESIDLAEAQERFGDPEIVDVRVFEDVEEDLEPTFTTREPKGKLN